MSFIKKYSSERSMKYMELHKKITLEGFRFSGYFYTGDRSGVCECGKVGLCHNFILESPEGQEIILGSTCIMKSELQVYIMDTHPKAWAELQKEIKLYKYLFRTIRAGDKAQEKITLEQLRELSKTIKSYWSTEQDRRVEQAKEILPLLQAYSFLGGDPFLSSVLDQAINGFRGLSNRQIEVIEQIIDSYNELKVTNEEEVLAEFKAKKDLPPVMKFEDDFFTITINLGLGTYDREVLARLNGNIERYGTLNDYGYGKACKLLHKYRGQINDSFWMISEISENQRRAGALLFVNAFNRLVEAKIIPILSKPSTYNKSSPNPAYWMKREFEAEHSEEIEA